MTLVQVLHHPGGAIYPSAGFCLFPANGNTDLSEIANEFEMSAANDRALLNILEGCPIGAAILSVDGRQRLYVNDALVNMFGADCKDDMMTRDIRESWIDEAKLEQAFACFRSGRPLVNFESERRRFDGAVCWILMNTQPITYRGEKAGIVWHVDITDRKIAEQEVINARIESDKANHAKSEFLAHVSHEFRTPLNSILGFSEVLLSPERYSMHENSGREYARIINYSGKHLLGIINSILDISKVEAGEYKLDKNVFDLNGVLDAARMLVQGMADQEDVSVTFTPHPDRPKIFGDERVIKQIVMNLLSNAIKFNVPGGDVALHAAFKDNGDISVIVKDTGIGIGEDDIPRVFEPFTQIRGSAHNAHRGTGLGLPLSKHLAELHGGNLQLRSEFGKGTEVRLTLPADLLRPS